RPPLRAGPGPSGGDDRTARVDPFRTSGGTFALVTRPVTLGSPPWRKAVRRREFIKVIAGLAAATWPFGTSAQEPGRIYRIGFLIPSPRERPPVAALFDELRLNGIIENQNLEVLSSGFDVRNEQTVLVKAA